MARITKRTVDALESGERERVVWDDDLKGFGVRVHPTGRRVYIVKTRYRGRPVKVTIGPHGVVAPAEARTRAAEIMSDARAGKDPAGWNRPDAKAPTMRELGQRLLEEYVPSHCKPSMAEEYRRPVQLFIEPGSANTGSRTSSAATSRRCITTCGRRPIRPTGRSGCYPKSSILPSSGACGRTARTRADTSSGSRSGASVFVVNPESGG